MGGFAVHCYVFLYFIITIEDFLIQYLCTSPAFHVVFQEGAIIFLSPISQGAASASGAISSLQVSQLLTKEEKDAELRAPTSGYKAWQKSPKNTHGDLLMLMFATWFFYHVDLWGGELYNV